jgi:hypothetical protein
MRERGKFAITLLVVLSVAKSVFKAGSWLSTLAWFHDTGAKIPAPPLWDIGACVAMGILIWLVWREIPGQAREKIRIAILSPLGNRVEHRQEVIGSIWPAKSPVQVLVYSDLWYPQGPVTVCDAAWNTTAWFGLPDSPSGTRLKVVAKSGGAIISEPVAQLPRDAVYSQEITVMRA